MRRRERDRLRRAARLLPPVEFLDVPDAGRSHEAPVAERRHDQGVEPLRERSQRRQIAMIVVIVTEQEVLR